MNRETGKKALKISVPLAVAAVLLKVLSAFLGWGSGDIDDGESPQAELIITGSASDSTVTESDHETDEPAESDEPYIVTEDAALLTEVQADDETAVTVSDAVPDVTETEEVTVTEYAEYTEYRFRNSKLLNDHYKKHGKEMGFESAEEYELAASDVVNSPYALHKKEKEDQDDVYYVEATNEFVVVSSDGYLRTYFYPDKGKAYYDRQ